MKEKKVRISTLLVVRLTALSNRLQRTENTIVNDALEFYLELFEVGTITDDELLAKVKTELKTKDQ